MALAIALIAVHHGVAKHLFWNNDQVTPDLLKLVYLD